MSQEKMFGGKKPEGMEPRFVETVDLSDVLFVRFRPGEDLFQEMTNVVKEKGIQRATILSGIGSLCDVAFRDLKTGITLPVNVDKTNLMEEYGPFELLTLEGNIVPLMGTFGDMKEGDPVIHLHCTLGMSYGGLFGGHLFKATVFTTTELFMAVVKKSQVQKKQSTVTGLTEMRTDL
jgi:predicted DNA-binding protein with PD1-like motif